MHIGRSNKVYDYSLDGSVLKEVAAEKDLGVKISKDLKVSHQCSSAYSKANKILGIINRTIVYKTKEVTLWLYKSAIRRHLEYFTAAWSPYYIKDKELIERIQHRFTKMIPELTRFTLYGTASSSYSGRKTNSHRSNQSLQNDKWHYFCEIWKFLEFDSYSWMWGHSYKLKKNCFNRELCQHFSTERIVNIWNNFEEWTVTAFSLNCFKRNLDQLKNSTQMGLFWTDVSRP